MTEYDITLTSKNEELTAFVAAPLNRLLEVVCTSFTCQTSIVILEKSDYIEFKFGDEKKVFHFNDNYIEMSEYLFPPMLTEMLSEYNIIVETINTGQLRFCRTDIENQDKFEITDMSYNVKLLTGFFHEIHKTSDVGEYGYQEIISDYVPYYLSTPVLYLISNLGATNYTNIFDLEACVSGMKTVIKINNTFSKSVPLTAGNCDFICYTTANVLSQSYFLLVDQNLHRVKLLDPFTITLKIRNVDPQQRQIN